MDTERRNHGRQTGEETTEDKKYRIAYLDDAIPAGQTALALLEEDFVNKDSVNQAAHTISQSGENVKRENSVATSVSDVATPPPCPYCGGETILRQSKKTDQSFYGCKAYPKCRGIVKIKE